MNNLKDTILQKIQTGELSMRPRWYFLLQGLGFFLATGIVALVVIYLASFVLFVLHQSGVWLAPLFGVAGIVLFVVTSPWLIISCTVFFLVVLHLLVRHYAFSYRRPLLYSLIGIVVTVVAIATLLHGFAMHDMMRDFSRRHDLPGLSPMYRDFGDRRPPGVVTGYIESVTKDGCLLRADHGETMIISFNQKTKLPRNWPLEPGARVIIFGDQVGTSTITAFGLRQQAGQDPEQIH